MFHTSQFPEWGIKRIGRIAATWAACLYPDELRGEWQRPEKNMALLLFMSSVWYMTEFTVLQPSKYYIYHYAAKAAIYDGI